MKEPPIVCKPRNAPAASAPPVSRSKWRAPLDSRPATFGLLFGITGFGAFRFYG